MSLQGREQFPKTARLRKRAEFLRLSRTGHKFHSANFVVVRGSNAGGESRLGVTVSGKVGNSVVRNRIKRRIREFFRRRRAGILPPADLLVIARQSAADISAKRIEAELEKLLIDPASRRGL